MIKPHTTIEPLREDLERLVPDSFLTTTEYKRWLVANNLQELWAKCLDYSQASQSSIVLGYQASIEAGDAMTQLLNHFYDTKRDFIPPFIANLLLCYNRNGNKELDTTNLRCDLLIAGFKEEQLSELDAIVDVEDEEESTDECLTQEEKIRQLEQTYVNAMHKEPNSRTAIDAYHEWYTDALLYLSDYYSVSNPDFVKFKELDNSHNGLGLRTNYHSIKGIYSLLMKNASKQFNVNEAKDKKSPMVFISHSSNDKEFVEALVDLLESIGLTKENLFCSSVDGYGIPLSNDIFETIRALFNEYELFVVFVHSPRYYESHVSLNEMGAAWVLKTDFCSLLTKDMEFNKMTGVVNRSSLSIKVDNNEAPARLTELKNKLTNIFGLIPLDEVKWERKRNQFLKLVKV